MITVQECIDLMAAAQTKKEATVTVEKKVKKVVTEVKTGDKTPEKGALEIAKTVENAPAEVPVETKKAANNVARKVLYQEDLKDAMQAFERIVNADIAKINEEIDSLKEDIKKLKENDAKQDETIGALSVVVVKNTKDIEEMKKEMRMVYGLFNFGFMTGMNKGLAELSLGLGLGIPFRWFTVEGGVNGGIDLVTNNMTTMANIGMVFPLKDWGDKGEISFLFNGLFYSVIKLPEDNVNDKLLGLGYYGGGNIGVRHVLPVGEKKVGLLFQGELEAMYGEGRDRTATGWKRTLEPIVALKLMFGVLF